MPYLNEFKFLGVLTKDAELRYSPKGAPLCLLSIALNGKKFDAATSDYHPHTTFIHGIQVWGKPGEACASNLGKGSLVLITGEIIIEHYEVVAEGKPAKRQATRFRADPVNGVQWLATKRPGQTTQPPSPAAKDDSSPTEGEDDPLGAS